MDKEVFEQITKGMRQEFIMIIKNSVTDIERKLDRYVELVYGNKTKGGIE